MRGPRALWAPAQAGLSHATPLEGCYVSGDDPSPAHAGGRVTFDGGFSPQIPQLVARVSRDRGLCCATPILGHGGGPAL